LVYFDEWVSLPSREVLGVGNCSGDKGGLLNGMQSEEINYK